MSLLPSKPDLVPSTEPRVVGVDSEDADALMSALSSGTARCLLSELHDEPAPPSALADRAGTTLQNTQYHLANLREAGAVEIVGTAYSEKGREMDVYAPADQPLVIFAGQDDEASGLRAALSRLVGGVGALLVGSLAVQEVFGDGVGRLVGFGTTGGGLGGGSDEPAARGGATTDTGTGSPTADGTSTADAASTGAGGGDGGATGGAGTATPQADGAGTPSPTSGDATAATGGGAGGDATRTAADTATEAPEAADAAATATSTATPTPTPEATQFAADGGIDALASLPPGALFFLGGLVVLVVAVALTAGR